MSYLITAVVLAAFGYFIYTRVEAAKKRRAEREQQGGGSGGGGRSPGDIHPK